jgi:hypothetical protein
MPSKRNAIEPFAVIDCAMLSIATGVKAQNLREMRDRLQDIPASSIYYHFWGHYLLPGFEDPEFNNDFANWADMGLHDRNLAERLSVIDPPSFTDLEGLRNELLDVIEQRLDESDFVPWSKPDDAFHFIRSTLIVFDTGVRIKSPEDLPSFLPHMSPNSLYYHFFDARRRTPEGIDDFRAWLAGFGDEYAGLSARLADIDPSFTTLTGLRHQLQELFTAYTAKGEK